MLHGTIVVDSVTTRMPCYMHFTVLYHHHWVGSDSLALVYDPYM